jgi:hypothetical protein
MRSMSIEYLMNELTKYNTIKKLNLSKNDLNDVDILSISKFIEQNDSLITLNLSCIF